MNQKQKLLELIDQYAEARHIQEHSTYNIKTAAARREVEDELERALSGVGETVAWALKVGEELHSVSRFEPRATSIPQNAVVIPWLPTSTSIRAAFAEIAMAFPKAFALHKVGIADTAVREALAAPARKQGASHDR